MFPSTESVVAMFPQITLVGSISTKARFTCGTLCVVAISMGSVELVLDIPIEMSMALSEMTASSNRSKLVQQPFGLVAIASLTRIISC